MGAVANPQKESMLNIDYLKKWLSEQVDRRIEKAVKLINLPTKDQINRLTADIETLAKQVDGLENRLVNPKSRGAASLKAPAKTVGGQA
jgi:DNA anti-recombination protein RmuC